MERFWPIRSALKGAKLMSAELDLASSMAHLSVSFNHF